MRTIRQRFSLVASVACLAMLFTNCTEQNADSILDGPTGTLQSLSTIPSDTFLIPPRFSPPQMECTQDHIQIGGVCETNGAEDNYIEYSLTRDKQPVAWNAGTQSVTVLREARCENGRYYIVIPRPDADTVIAPNDTARCYALHCYAEYQLNSRIFAKKVGSNQYDLIYTAPALNLSIQLILNQNGQRVCPP